MYATNSQKNTNAGVWIQPKPERNLKSHFCTCAPPRIDHIPCEAVCFCATQRDNSLIPFFKPKNIFLTSTNTIFNIITYTHSFRTFNQKRPLKMGIQENNLHIFLWYLKIWIFFKKYFRNLEILKFGVPKKITPKSQAKNKPPFLQYPFFSYF